MRKSLQVDSLSVSGSEQQTTSSPESVYVKEGVPGGDGIVGDFVVGPGKIDIELKPGESKVVEMMVTNRTGERRTFNLTTEDTAGSTDVNRPIVLLGSERGPYSLRDYLHVPDTHFELEHNERARIPVTITIPPDAEPGGLYGTMLVDTIAIKSNEGDYIAGISPITDYCSYRNTLFCYRSR